MYSLNIGSRPAIYMSTLLVVRFGFFSDYSDFVSDQSGRSEEILLISPYRFFWSMWFMLCCIYKADCIMGSHGIHFWFLCKVYLYSTACLKQMQYLFHSQIKKKFFFP